MRRLSNERRAPDKAESGLWAEREALGRLAAERDARQDTIDRLRSAEEMAVREGGAFQKSANIAIQLMRQGGHGFKNFQNRYEFSQPPGL
jgi:hypothetical protein